MQIFNSRFKALAALLLWMRAAVAAPPTAPTFVKRLGSDPGIIALAFDADGHSLVSVGAEGQVIVWDIQTGAALLQRHFPPQHLTLSPDGHFVAVVLTDVELRAFKSNPGAPTTSAAPNATPAPTPQVGVAVWDIRTNQLRCAIYPFKQTALLRPLVTALAFAPDSRSLAIATGAIDYSAVGLWDTTQGNLSRTLPPIPGDFHASYGVPALAFTPDGKTLIVSTLATRTAFPPSYQAEGDARLPVPVVGLWDKQSGQWRGVFPGSRAPFCLSPDGKRLATTTVDRQGTQLWDVATTARLSMLKLVGTPVLPLRFAPDSQGLWCYSNALTLFDSQSGASLVHLNANPRISKQIFSPDGQLLARGLDNGTVEIWRVGK